ncbi:MAG: Holliday junction resolvase YqgF [Frankiales bacterium]|nr:Holliday junction resolvase YqgF [Frankiales bacterium]
MKGVIVAVDVGTVRVGVAASDPHRILASPVETVAAPGHQRVLEILAERDAVKVVVGLPTSLSGHSTSASADMAREWAATLQGLTDLPLELVDERLTTVTATQALRAAGKKGKQARAVIDQAAAVALLQAFLDAG